MPLDQCFEPLHFGIQCLYRKNDFPVQNVPRQHVAPVQTLDNLSCSFNDAAHDQTPLLLYFKWSSAPALLASTGVSTKGGKSQMLRRDAGDAPSAVDTGFGLGGGLGGAFTSAS
tara:strand:- start:1625 stop:1966 length:342 start_codon:yes stop_codon:yes gene_type:complete